MIRPLAKQKGLTERGNRYILSQYAPNVIQVTLQCNDFVMSETLENLQSEQDMLTRRNTLEDEFIKWMNTLLPLPKQTHETDNQISQ